MSFFWKTPASPWASAGKTYGCHDESGTQSNGAVGASLFELAPDARVLDCGCGGANIKRLLKKCPQGIVKGIDYSPVSVEKTGKSTRRHRKGTLRRSARQRGKMMFAEGWFDAVTAFETVYFWPELPQCFHEIHRMLKPGGMFLICNESNGDTDKDEKWTKIINGMTIYKDVELKSVTGTRRVLRVQIHKNKKGLAVRHGAEKEIEHGNFASEGMNMERKRSHYGAARIG